MNWFFDANKKINDYLFLYIFYPLRMTNPIMKLVTKSVIVIACIFALLLVMPGLFSILKLIYHLALIVIACGVIVFIIKQIANQ